MHGPLLAQVKVEYERNLTASQHGDHLVDPFMPLHHLRPLHPLQLPASYYEARWREANQEVQLLRLQRKRLRTMVRKLRTGCVDALGRLEQANRGGEHPSTQRAANAAMQDAGGDGGASTPPRWLLSDYFEHPAGDGGLATDPERAITASRAVVNEEVEAAVDAELAQLRERLGVLELRLTAAVRVAQRSAQGSMAARCMLEEIVEESVSQADARGGSSPTHVLLRMLRVLEQQVGETRRLLESKWDGAAQLEELRKVASGT